MNLVYHVARITYSKGKVLRLELIDAKNPTLDDGVTNPMFFRESLAIEYMEKLRQEAPAQTFVIVSL